MRNILTVILILILGNIYAQDQKLQFFQTNWGNTLSWDAFCERTKKSGFDGIDVWLPADTESQKALRTALKKHGLLLNLMHGTNKNIPFKQSLAQFEEKLKVLTQWNPVLVNCHTGSDFFTQEQNQAFIKIANKISKESGIPVYHETHRGRFSYTLPNTKKYVSAIPDLKLTLDISHWMVVHESLLEGQDENLREIVDHSHHIHARVGHAEGPQVNDPEAPEWKKALDRHLDIWEQIICKRWSEGQQTVTITSEFGPPAYLPALPYTQIPVADQWKANVFIMNALKKRMKIQ
ncbi:sugar phosphate isomerase/epimerase family protein [Flagellimonas pacifica]|uniref:Sugar phosphate isomerase/epimerase n=1 Tax=Flagellimonas pacifica TaxID=1247520 RepID=A0A285M4G8_9FLAO|nr:TIM barrel protein [Allomuricauda parva]SNY92008.1 Sugar phosphate isomerase/epimerase [Allomuricauda parva]